MSRYIDADALIRALNDEDIEYRADVDEVIRATPTADVEQVVRCKDCKHVTDAQEKGVFNICWQHSEEGEEVYPNGFCSYGEKSDE